MPTVLSVKGHRFFFFSLEGNEPPHIHVEYEENVAKFWLNPIALASSYGFKSHELARIRAIIIKHRELFVERWHEFFGN